MDSLPLLIGLAGPAGCGKSTVGGVIASRDGWERVSFAGPIKDSVCAGLDLTPAELDARKRTDPSIRRWMRVMGDHGRLMSALGYVAHAAVRTRRARDRGRCVVIDDVRMVFEAKAIRGSGGIVVHVHRDGVEFSRDHDTERGVAGHSSDLHLENSGSIYAMRGAVDRLLASLTQSAGQAA